MIVFVTNSGGRFSWNPAGGTGMGAEKRTREINTGGLPGLLLVETSDEASEIRQKAGTLFPGDVIESELSKALS